MNVTFNTNFCNQQGLTINAVITINNTILNDDNLIDIRRYFSDISDSFSITTDGVNHTIYIDFAGSATICDINDAMDLLAEDLTELA